MTIEERIELHDQWLLSMESNQSQMSASLSETVRTLGELTRKHDRFTELVLTLGQNQSVLFISMAKLSSEMEALAEQHRKLEQTVERLEQAVERYIRFRGNGHSEN